MKVKVVSIYLSLWVAFFIGGVEAQVASGSQELIAKLKQSLEVSSQGQLQILAIKDTPLEGIFEIELNTGELLYSDEAGSYLFAGDMYQTTMSGLVNLSSETRQTRTQEKIANIAEEEMIIYTPKVDVKATLTVFTDVDCTYCRALHKDVEELLEQGIEIRYLAYPRGGEAADSYEKMISVWCSGDRHKSLTQAKNGQNLPERECETPILDHYQLGNEIGISGTPALIFPDGRLIPGYMDVDRLVALLNIN